MSEVFQVSTNNIIPTRQANIDGVIYTVRRKGSGDDLDISIRSSKLAKIGRESISDRNRLSQAKTDEERAEITEKLEKAMMKVAELQDEMDAGKVATDYQAPELTVTNVETEITSYMLLVDSLSVGVLIVLSTCAASVLIFRKNPKDILSEMS